MLVGGHNTTIFTLQDEEVGTKEEAEYLGISLVYGNIDIRRFLQRIKSARKRLQQIVRSFRTKRVTMKIGHYLVLALIQPMISYGTHLLQEDEELEIETTKLIPQSIKRCCRTASQKLRKRAQAALRIDDYKVTKWKQTKNLIARLRESTLEAEEGRERQWALELELLYTEMFQNLHRQNEPAR